ncbi:MAG: VIT1/CCC1 transporter family protein [bacterium]|nr:VIT1/CCC1 transporter family protein [bacterium]
MKEMYIRNIIFGVTDSLVSTVGFLAGISASGVTKEIIILTGLVYTFVEAFSMAAGSFLSEDYAEAYKDVNKISNNKPFFAAIAMFVSYVLVSIIPIIPYFFFVPKSALWISIAFSLSALFIAGASVAKISKIKPVKHALKMVFLGGIAIIIGVIVGKIIKIG